MSRPSRTSPSTRPTAAVAAASRPSVTRRRSARAATVRAAVRLMTAVDRLDDRRVQRRRGRPGRSRRAPVAGLERPVEVEPGRRDRGPVARCDRRREPRRRARRVWRRREIPRGGATSSTTAPTTRSAPDDRRRTSRSPGATAIGPASRRIAERGSVGQVERVPAAPADARLDRRGPEHGGAPATDRAWPCAARRGPGRWPRPTGRPSARARGGARPASTPARLSAVRPGSAAIDGRAVDLDLADPDRPVARHEPEGGAASEPRPRSVPVTTTPRPLTAKTRSIASRATRLAGARSPAARGTAAPATSRRAARPARRATPRSRRHPPTRRRRPASRRAIVPSSSRATAATTSAVRAGPATSALVTTATPCRIPSASSSARCSIVWARGPSSAATTSIAASISPAPTSMLPTSRSCPGTSTKSSSVPSGSAQVRVADVDRHPAPPLLGQPVGVDPGQRPQQRRLAVVDVAGRPDDDGHPVARRRRWPGTIAPGQCRILGRVDRAQVEHDGARPRRAR